MIKTYNNKNEMDLEKLKENLAQAIKEGNLPALKKVLSHPRYGSKQNKESSYYSTLMKCCTEGQLELIQYFLLDLSWLVHYKLKDIMWGAVANCDGNIQLPVVQYLLKYAEDKKVIDPLDKNIADIALSSACSEGRLDIIEYLLLSPELEKNASIKFENSLPLRKAVEYNQIEVVKYLISSPDLKEHASIYSLSHFCMREALSRDFLEITKILVSAYPKNKLKFFYENNKEELKNNTSKEYLNNYINSKLQSEDLSKDITVQKIRKIVNL